MPITVDQSGSVAIVTLDRPDQRNAMSADLVARLIEAIARLDSADDIGAIMMCGAGRGFCAGSDLAGLAAMDMAAREAFEAASGRAARMLAHTVKPVVAAVHGFAIGGGLTLATSCDLVVTDAGSKWSLPEVPIGLFPAWGIASVAQRIGVPAARRLCWGIDTLSGTEAIAIGLADVEAADPRAEAAALAARLAELPRSQTAAVKRYFAPHAPDEATDIAANALFLEAAETPEAAASFMRYGRAAGEP